MRIVRSALAGLLLADPKAAHKAGSASQGRQF